MTAPAAPRDCQHESFTASVDVYRFEDTGKFMADVRVNCAQCQLPMRFIGAPAGVNFSQPMVSIDGTELHAPIEPEDEKLLHSGASFTMPKIPARN